MINNPKYNRSITLNLIFLIGMIITPLKSTANKIFYYFFLITIFLAFIYRTK